MKFKTGQTLKTKRQIRYKDRINGFCYIPSGELVEVVSVNKAMKWITISYQGIQVIIMDDMFDQAFEK